MPSPTWKPILRRAILAAAEQPQNKRQKRAEQQRRDDRKIEGRVLSANDDIAGEMAESHGHFLAERNDHAERHYY
jgi:hypothetical protein